MHLLHDKYLKLRVFINKTASRPKQYFREQMSKSNLKTVAFFQFQIDNKFEKHFIFSLPTNIALVWTWLNSKIYLTKYKYNKIYRY